MPGLPHISRRSVFAHPTALGLLCVFTGLSGAWLGTMSIRLHHPGYQEQILIAAGITAQAILTLVALRLPCISSLRYLSLLGCIGMLWLSAKATLAIVNGAEMEGYVVLIALALVIQSVLTFFTLSAPRQFVANRT